jgi:phage regulator Rha-like protein
MYDILKNSEVESKIISLRNTKVILDSDVAQLYGVATMRINEAVKNNPDKFPEGYLFELNAEEKKELIENFDNLKVKFSPAMPKAFTEKGLYMLATILKSKKATETTLAIVEAFAKLRELTGTIAEIASVSDANRQKKLMVQSGEIISDLLGDELHISDTETTIELNFAVVKLKHTIKRK